ncbi:hypothetical protein D3C80_1026220 [compost metagenome]
MLNYNSLTAAASLADKLAGKGIALRAIEGTPLATLIRAGYLPNPDSGTLEMSVEERIMFGASSKNAGGIVEHDMVMDEVLEVLKKTVSWNMDLARNQVNPCVQSAMEFVNQYVDDAMTLKNTALSIKEDTFNPIWDSHYLHGMVERFNETPVKDVRLSIAVPMPDGIASPMALIETGIARFNSELESFIADQAPDLVQSIYNKIFVSRGEDYQPSLLAHLNHLYVEPNQILLIHLMAARLLDQTPEGVRAGAAEYKEYIAEIMAQSGRAVVRALERRESSAKRKTLINDWSQYREDDIGITPIQIRVNSDIYHKFLEAGGTPEVLFGAFVSDRNYSFDMLLERKEQYIKVWQSQERVMATNLRLQKANHFQTGLVRAVEKQIADLPDDLLVTERPIYIRALHAYVKEMPNNWYEDNLYLTLRKVICNVMFPHTNAFDILSTMDVVALENPELEIREVGLLALIEFIPTWVATLITVDSPTN